MAKLNRRQKRIAISSASKNVLADLEFPDADEHETKAKLVIEIMRLLKKQALTQTEAAKKLGIGQPRVSDMFKGRFRGFSVGRLMHFVKLLGRRVDIVIRDPRRPTKIEVAIAVS